MWRFPLYTPTWLWSNNLCEVTYLYMRKFYEKGHFLGHRGVYRCKFGVNWCVLLCLHYFVMQMTFFILQVVGFLSFCSRCCHSYMVVKATVRGGVG